MIETEKVLDEQGTSWIAEIFPVGVLGYDEDVWAYRFISPGDNLGVVVNTELRNKERAIRVVRVIASATCVKGVKVE